MSSVAKKLEFILATDEIINSNKSRKNRELVNIPNSPADRLCGYMIRTGKIRVFNTPGIQIPKVKPQTPLKDGEFIFLETNDMFICYRCNKSTFPLIVQAMINLVKEKASTFRIFFYYSSEENVLKFYIKNSVQAPKIINPLLGLPIKPINDWRMYYVNEQSSEFKDGADCLFHYIDEFGIGLKFGGEESEEPKEESPSKPKKVKKSVKSDNSSEELNTSNESEIDWNTIKANKYSFKEFKSPELNVQDLNSDEFCRLSIKKIKSSIQMYFLISVITIPLLATAFNKFKVKYLFDKKFFEEKGVLRIAISAKMLNKLPLVLKELKCVSIDELKERANSVTVCNTEIQYNPDKITFEDAKNINSGEFCIKQKGPRTLGLNCVPNTQLSCVAVLQKLLKVTKVKDGFEVKTSCENNKLLISFSSDNNSLIEKYIEQLREEFEEVEV